jgi:hypothetical protein
MLGVLAGCNAAPPTNGSPVLPTASSDSISARARGDALSRLLITDVPAGYVRAPDAEVQAGLITNPARIALSAGPPHDELIRDGWLLAYERAWRLTGAGQGALTVTVNEFSTPTGAQMWARYSGDSGSRILASIVDGSGSPLGQPVSTPASTFGIPGLPIGFGAVWTGKGGADYHVSIAGGIYEVDADLWGSAGAVAQATAVRLAKAEYALLPG